MPSAKSTNETCEPIHGSTLSSRGVAESETVAAVMREMSEDVVVREDAPECRVDVAPVASGFQQMLAGFHGLEADGRELTLSRGGLAVDDHVLVKSARYPSRTAE